MTLRPTTVIYFSAHLILLLIGVLLWQQNEPLIQAIGASVAAAGIAGMVVWVHLAQSGQSADALRSLDDVGLRRAFLTRGISIRDEYESRLAKAHNQIDILGFGMSSLRQDLAAQFPMWKKRCRVRILLVDPTSASASLRDAEEGNAPGTIASDVQLFCDAAAHLLDDRFSIRLYKCIPAINVFRVDDVVFWGPYLINTPSRNTVTLLAHAHGGLFTQITKHFDDIWDSDWSKPVPPTA